MKIRSVITVLLAAVLTAGLLPVSAAAAPKDPFDDVKENSWYAPYVYALREQGVIEGVDASHFAPQTELTRAQLVTMLTPELGEEAMAVYAGKNRYSDVKKGSWYTPYVNWASDQGWIAGYEDGTFRPDRALTRAEAAAILVKYAQKTDSSILKTREEDPEKVSDDKEIPDWARDAVYKSLKAGLFSGYPDGTFGPKRPITRAEISVVLCRLYEIDPEKESGQEEEETTVTEDGITHHSYPVLGTTVDVVSFHPKDGFEADVILANDRLYSSEAASSMVKRSGAAIAVNGTYFNNSDLGILSSLVRNEQVLRIENAHSQANPCFVVDT